MTVVELLRQNDPARTSVRIRLCDEYSSSAALALALEQNPFVTEIDVEFARVQTTEWGALLRVIVTRENLGKVTLRDAYYADERNAPPTLVRAFLRSIQQNNSIRCVLLQSLRLPADVSTFVDTASSITSLILSSCDFAPTERDDGTRDFAVALQRNTNINTLELGFMDDSSAVPILQSLQANVSLKTLVIGGNATISGVKSSAIQQLLESTSSIQTFALLSSSFAGDEFRPVAQGIMNSRSVSKLTMLYCQLRDEESTAIFRSILQEKRNLTSLRLCNCSFGGELFDTIISNTLSRPDSALRTLEFESFLTFTVGQLQNLFRAVEKSKLERFKIGHFRSHDQFQALTESIPSMRIKELIIVFTILIDEGNAKREVLQAVKNNFSLRSVESRHDQRDLFNDDDKLRLVFYADRNERLDQWVNNPETVDQKVWPDALQLAQKAGPNSLFQGLRTVLGSDYVSLPGVRKRKVSHHTTPQIN